MPREDSRGPFGPGSPSLVLGAGRRYGDSIRGAVSSGNHVCANAPEGRHSTAEYV